MVILHIAHLEGRPFSGVDVAVPRHIREQQKYAQVGFINVTNLHIEGIENQFSYDSSLDLQKLPAPYHQPDIVIFHEIYRPAFLKLSRQIMKQGIPYIVVPHGGLTNTAQNQKKLKKMVGNALLFGRYIRNAAAIQCLSEREKNESRFHHEKFIGSNGIYIQNKKSTFFKNGMKLLYIGRLDIQVKGLDLLFQAIHNCKELLMEKRCSFQIYGPDEFGEHEKLEAMVQEHQLQDVVFLHDAITGEEKLNELMSADCFIQTSRTEGMPMGILEAQAMGLPCIVTEGTGMADMIRRYDSGWGCETTTEGIEQAVRKALDEQSQFETKSAQAVKMIEDNYEWGHVTKRVLKLYKNYIEVERKKRG